MDETLKPGDQVVIGPQLDGKHDFLYRGYFAEVIEIKDEYAFLDSDRVQFEGSFQSVSFKAWLPIRTLTKTG